MTTTALPELRPPTVVTEPGVYLDMPNDVYHRDPVPEGSLSVSGARKLLPPSCPAIFDYDRSHPPESTKTLDIGTTAHCLVLGAGPEIVVVDAEDWRTNKAKDQRVEAQLRGAVALLRKDYEPIVAMAEALAKHPVASKLIRQEGAQAEASAFFRDDETGVMRRCRFDLLPPPRESGRLIIPDYKSARSANPEQFAKAAIDYGYAQQNAWYCDAAVALELGEDPVFLFVVQEKTPPYLVSVVQLDLLAVRIGRHLNRQALDVYAECVRTGIWPGYADDVAHVSLPAWFERQFEEEL